jgi:hypothetical protein
MGCEFVVVSAAFLLNDVSYGRYLYVGVECCIGDIPWCVDYHSLDVRLASLDYYFSGVTGAAP